MGRHWGREFDEDQLRHLVRTMTPRGRFYQVLREELKRVGRWKYLPRGRAFDESGRYSSQTDAPAGTSVSKVSKYRPRGKPGDPLKQARQIDANDEF